MVDQLSGLDATFLGAETDTVHLHGIGIVRLEPGADPLSVDDLVALVEARLERLPPLRHRLVTVPAGLDHPYWVDTIPRVEDHIHHVVLPGKAPDEFSALCASLAEEHLDRTRPLWQFWLVDGLPGGAQALVIKLHHSVSDGVGSLAIVAGILDMAPDSDDAPESAELAAETPPGPLWLLVHAAGHMARWPVAAVRTALEVGSSALRLGRTIREEPGGDRAAPLIAPRLVSSGKVSAARSAELRDLPLKRVKEAAHAADVRVNDVILAVLAGAVRRWLEAHDDLPDQPLVAAVPVSTRTVDELTAPGNHVSACFMHLTTHLADPLERLRVTASSAGQAKSAHQAIGGDVLAHFTSLALPITVVTSLRLYSGLGLPSLHPPAVNLVVSNVPGPPFSLYLAGRRADRFYALGPIFDGTPLNVTAVSYDGALGIGLIACPDRVPDLAALADGLAPSFEELATALGI